MRKLLFSVILICAIVPCFATNGMARPFINKDTTLYTGSNDSSFLMIAFTGGFTGKGEVKPEIGNYAGTTGMIVNKVRRFSYHKDIDFHGLVIGSGLTQRKSIKNAVHYIETHADTNTVIYAYGYSWGGDFAVELAEKLHKKHQSIELLFTVDATDGPFQNLTVQKKIPDNVRTNYNYYQTMNLGSSSASNFVLKSRKGLNVGSLNLPGSNGKPNKARNKEKTAVVNCNMTKRDGTYHTNIDEKVREKIEGEIIKNISWRLKNQALSSRK